LEKCELRDGIHSLTPVHAEHLLRQMGIDLAFPTRKNWRVTMFLSGYIIAFIIGVGFGFLLAAKMILSGLDQTT
jgi:hypothetical protein